MRAIRIENPVLNTYLTDLDSDYVPTQASPLNLNIRSTNSFSINDLIVVGNPTEEYAEEKKISALADITDFTLASALNFQHGKGTNVYKAIWDNVSLESAPGSSGPWTVVSLSPIQWDNRDNKTIVYDPNGSDSISYRFRFYNSVTLVYSEYSPTLSGTGFTKYQMGYIIRQARLKAGDKEAKVLTTEECLRVLTGLKNAIRSHNPRFWFWKVNGYNSGTPIPAVAGNSIYSLATITDLGPIDLLEYRYTQGGTDFKWVLRRKSDIEFLEYTRNLKRPSFDFPHYFRILPPDINSAKGYFEVELVTLDSNVGNFYVDYYKEEPDYTSVGSLTSIIIPEILEDGLTAAIYEAKGNQTEADRYYDLFSGPEQNQKTKGTKPLTGIAMLDSLDKQYKISQGQPTSLWRFRGQKGIQKLFGNRMVITPDYIRENYFDGPE